jgi:hypothetical protein
MAQTTVADLTIDEFKKIIDDSIEKKLLELFADPDEGLELREDFVAELKKSLKITKGGANTKSAKEVAASFGIDWDKL